MVNVLSSGIWTGVSVDEAQFSGLQTDRLRWGDVEDSVKSAYVFKGWSTQVPLDGTRCRVGQFEHHNHVIPMPPHERFTADLTITVAFGDNDRRTIGPVQFQHHETPNQSSTPEDEVLLKEVSFPQVVQVEGHWYDMLVQGFLQYGQIAPKFVSPEGTVNSADLVVSFTPYRGGA
jgi:hypothetical protein